MEKLRFIKLDKELPTPKRANLFDAGIDLYSAESVELYPGERKLVNTGIAIELENNTVGFITPRSGLALKYGLSIVNSPGTIDSGYRGEIKVCLINLDKAEKIKINRAERIAQLVVLPIFLPELVECDELTVSDRGDLGYGSTGVK